MSLYREAAKRESVRRPLLSERTKDQICALAGMLVVGVLMALVWHGVGALVDKANGSFVARSVDIDVRIVAPVATPCTERVDHVGRITVECHCPEASR